MSLKRARTDVTASEKLELLERFKKLPKMSERKAAEALKVKRGFLRLAIQHEAKIRAEVAEQRGSNRKRHRTGKNEDVEDGLYDWYKFAKLRDVTVNGPILRQKSEQLAQQMSYDDFSATEGWFHRWKVRYGLESLGKVQGESKEADGKAANAWAENNVAELIEKYGPDNIYNADETGFYFRALPDSTYVEKSKKRSERGVKVAKDRVTVLVCNNMAGSKSRLLVIGKSKQPRCFKNVKTFPTEYRSSQNAWMTSQIWTNWLQNWDLQLCKENKKILLLVDNCSAHVDVPLKQIQMMFLPPNTASVIQPCNMGIIRALKAYARHEISCRIIEKIDDSVEGDTKTANEIAKEISVLDAMHILATSWEKVTAKCIQNCWGKAKFKTKVQDRAVEDAEDVDMPPAPADMTENDFLQWVDIDNNVEIATEETIEEREQEIVARYTAQSEIVKSEDEEEPEEPDPVPIPQNADMRNMLDQLRIGLETKGFPSMEEFDTFAGQIRDFLRKDLVQRNITEFFAPKTN